MALVLISKLVKDLIQDDKLHKICPDTNDGTSIILFLVQWSNSLFGIN